MKGSHSRLSHQPAQRYSGVAHVQGGMITDADLNEAAQIHQARDDAQGVAFAGAGVPAAGGMVAWDEEDQLILRDGTVFAQGKQGTFQIGGETLDLAEAMQAQYDLPDGPEATPGLVYVDMWERAVFAHEDPYLADAALHGAETSYRTRTMVQLKTLPHVKDVDGALKAFEASPAFWSKGTAELNVTLRGGETSIDACDPCADIINIDKVLPNALFRVEVLSVEREKGKTVAVRLAWSMENAETVEPLATRTALERDTSIYEYVSEATESQAGYFHDAYTPARGAFSTDLTAETPSDDTLPGTRKDGFTHVRRWDGMARIPLDTRAKATGPSAAASGAKANTAQISFATEMFNVAITHDGFEMVAGDYWLIELRRYAPEGAQVLLNGHLLDDKFGQPPLGPKHSFCPIGIWNGKGFEDMPNMLRRRLSFPTLADLPADHVGYIPDPECDLLGGTETVQDALDRVCEIDAVHVGFTPSDPDCETLGKSRSVDQALNALCQADNNKQLQLMLRTMMDWGVVCGASVEQGPKGIDISGGVVLDRTGLLHELSRDTVVLSDLKEGQLLPSSKEFAALAKRNVEICLSVGFRGKDRAYFLSPAALVYDASDLTLSDRVDACLEGRGSLTESDIFEQMPGNEGRMTALTMMHVCLRNDIRPLPGMEFTKTQDAIATTLLEDLIQDHTQRLEKAGDPLANRKGEDLRKINDALTNDLKNSGLKGTSGQLLLVARTLGLVAIMKKDEEFRLECLCSRVVPDCPPVVAGWTLVPLACVTLSDYRQGRVSETDVCMMCCRKQANTPRSQRYYNGDLIGTILSGFKELCTAEELRADNAPASRLRAWLTAAGPAPWDPPKKDNTWPAKPTYGSAAVQVTGPFYGGGGGADVLNEWKRGYNPPPVDITGMKSDEAVKRLEQAGFKIAEKFDVKAIGQVLQMAGNRPLLNRRPGPGDEVVLLDREGVAVEFIVIKQATKFGKFTLFNRGVIKRLPLDTMVLAEVEGLKNLDKIIDPKFTGPPKISDVKKPVKDHGDSGGKDQPAPARAPSRAPSRAPGRVTRDKDKDKTPVKPQPTIKDVKLINAKQFDFLNVKPTPTIKVEAKVKEPLKPKRQQRVKPTPAAKPKETTRKATTTRTTKAVNTGGRTARRKPTGRTGRTGRTVRKPK